MLLTSSYMQALGSSLVENFNVGKFFMTIVPFIPFIGTIILFVFIYNKYREIRKFWKGY